MTVKVYKFRELDEIDLFCAGAVLSSVDVSKWGKDLSGAGNFNTVDPSLVGLTLIFDAPGPSGTVTFVAGASPDGRLKFSELKSQIETAISGLTVRTFQGRLVFVESTPVHGVTVDHAGTANQVLGFDIGNNSVGKFYNTPYGSAPTTPYVMFAYSVNDNMHVLYTWE